MSLLTVGIDATNIRAGGGLNHLVETLNAASPERQGVGRVVVWAAADSLSAIEPKPWMEQVAVPALSGGTLARRRWQRRKLPSAAREAGCAVVYSLAGMRPGDFRPYVAFHQNLLPFEPAERARFGLSVNRLRYQALERAQTHAFREADGMVYLTPLTKEIVEDRMGAVSGVTRTIPYGISTQFEQSPRTQKPISAYAPDRPFKLLYVSIVNRYKHQWHVVEAATALRSEGYPVTLDLIGPSEPGALKRVQEAMARHDPNGEVVTYHGRVPYQEMAARYRTADAAVFASSCESFGQIVLEAMNAGLPVASSDRSGIPGVLQDTGVYFDPESPASITRAVRGLLDDPAERARLAQAAFELSATYSWERCADETFAFLAEIAQSHSAAAIR